MRLDDDQPLPPPVRGRMHNSFIGHEAQQGEPSGIVIDGAVYPLEGQPPIAVSHGWGDLTWLRWKLQSGIRLIGRW
jgi:hypothetical protein